VRRWYASGQGSDAVLSQMNVPAGIRETMIPDIQGSVGPSAGIAASLARASITAGGGFIAGSGGAVVGAPAQLAAPKDRGSLFNRIATCATYL
jgi:hypothetical protein